MANNATIKDVAKYAGVSISTVSRVLNKSAPVNDELIARVSKAVEATGYVPNEIARSLKHNRSALIAFVVSDFANPFFSGISRGIEDGLFAYGYNLINCSTDSSPDREAKLLETLAERRVDGIIINTAGNNDELIMDLSKKTPIILSNRLISSPEFKGDFVDFDNVGGLLKLANHVVSLGHRKISLINGPLYLSTAAERENGFRRAMSLAGIEVNEDYIINAEKSFNYNDGYQGTMKLFSLDTPPTAIIAANNETALGCISYCKEHNIRIPEDVSVCCFGNILNSELLYVNITHTSTDLYSLGTRIAELMISRMSCNNDEMANRELRFDTPLEVRDSTANHHK